jgi:hypothetical protein
VTDPFSPLRIVSIQDPALDLESMGDDVAEYVKTRDESLLKFKLGMKPTIATIGSITMGYLVEAVYSSPNAKTQATIAFLGAVHEIETPEKKLTPKKLEQGAYKQQIASDEWLDLVRDHIGANAILEFGRVAIKRAELPKSARGPFV